MNLEDLIQEMAAEGGDIISDGDLMIWIGRKMIAGKYRIVFAHPTGIADLRVSPAAIDTLSLFTTHREVMDEVRKELEKEIGKEETPPSTRVSGGSSVH